MCNIQTFENRIFHEKDFIINRILCYIFENLFIHEYLQAIFMVACIASIKFSVNATKYVSGARRFVHDS